MRRIREQRDDLVKRIPRFQVAIAVTMFVVLGSYWFVQVVRGDYYRELAENNRLRKLPIEAARGSMYDREGTLLVENVPSYNLLLDVTRSRNPGESLRFASGILGRSTQELRAALERQRSVAPVRPILIGEDLKLSEVARFAAGALEHPEFEVEVSHLRLYRVGPVAAHVLGHLGEASEGDLKTPDSPYRAGDLLGKSGAEKAFDLELKGRDGERAIIVDSRGRLLEEHDKKAAVGGQDLTLTLNLELQQEAHRYLSEKVGAAVALDPNTGEVLVLVSSPSYNPNIFSRRLDQDSWQRLVEDPRHPLQNRAIQNTYPPGSIFKIAVALAALSEKVVTPRNQIYCTGATRIYNRRFRCWKRGGHGWVNARNAIKQSCDVYFYHLGKALGISAIARYARLLGFGERTGIDIPGEKQGLVPDPEWSLQRRGAPWYPGETISVAIGQGPLLVTPLQMASVFATVATGGNRVSPRLAGSGGTDKIETLEVDREFLNLIKEGLWAVVNEQGTGSVARVAGIDIAGKTGTAQVVRQSTRIDSEDLPEQQRDHAWFASFAPAEEPELVVVVFVEHGGKGSAAAAPLAKRLYEIYFRSTLESRRAV